MVPRTAVEDAAPKSRQSTANEDKRDADVKPRTAISEVAQISRPSAAKADIPDNFEEVRSAAQKWLEQDSRESETVQYTYSSTGRKDASMRVDISEEIEEVVQDRTSRPNQRVGTPRPPKKLPYVAILDGEMVENFQEVSMDQDPDSSREEETADPESGEELMADLDLATP